MTTGPRTTDDGQPSMKRFLSGVQPSGKLHLGNYFGAIKQHIDLQNEAERLGYAVLVAEGSALVMAIIQTGKIDALVGVSCLSVLEKAFPYMESAAIPGVAGVHIMAPANEAVVPAVIAEARQRLPERG